MERVKTLPRARHRKNVALIELLFAVLPGAAVWLAFALPMAWLALVEPWRLMPVAGGLVGITTLLALVLSDFASRPLWTDARDVRTGPSVAALWGLQIGAFSGAAMTLLLALYGLVGRLDVGPWALLACAAPTIACMRRLYCAPRDHDCAATRTVARLRASVPYAVLGPVMLILLVVAGERAFGDGIHTRRYDVTPLLTEGGGTFSTVDGLRAHLWRRFTSAPDPPSLLPTGGPVLMTHGSRFDDRLVRRELERLGLEIDA